MKIILLSLLVVGAVGGTAIFATNAFFSDTETSSGNTFAAGKVDLTIDSTAHYDGMECVEGKWKDENDSTTDNPRPELLGTVCTGTWPAGDLTSEKFFNLTDVKPGDWGENTISMHVEDNPVWACIDIKNMVNSENSIIEPEAADDQSADVGELAQNINFTAWADTDCDNVWGANEQLLFANQTGPASDVLNGKTYVLADATQPTPFPGKTTSCIGLQWCAGTMILNRDSHAITCDGASMGNDTQTDSLTADVAFRVEQSRNNPDFRCNDINNRTVVVNTNNMNGWFGYNDENDVVDNTLISFVPGPASTPAGNGSIQMTVSGSQRRNIATQLLQGTKLSDIDTLKFSTYQASPQYGTERAIYLHFNVSFNGVDSWQRRLVFVPAVNGTVLNDSWQEWDTTSGFWTYSGFAANGNKWPIDNNTNEYRTWSELVSAYPNIKMLGAGLGWFGLRAGEPYADGFTGNTDKVVIGINGVTTIYDFEQ